MVKCLENWGYSLASNRKGPQVSNRKRLSMAQLIDIGVFIIKFNVNTIDSSSLCAISESDVGDYHQTVRKSCL